LTATSQEIAVQTAAGVGVTAEPGEVMVSSAVRDPVEFSDHSLHNLKDGPGDWRLFVVR
jgi:class 3 adenylate cyclase